MCDSFGGLHGEGCGANHGLTVDVTLVGACGRRAPPMTTSMVEGPRLRGDIVVSHVGGSVLHT